MSDAQYRVLQFEDDDIDAELVQRALASGAGTSFEVTRSASLEEGRDLLREQRFDVVLLDLSLPDSFGVETYEAVKEAGIGVPVVIMSGHDDLELGAQLVQMGAQDYLVKANLEGSLLTRALRYAIERQRAQRV